MKTRSNQNILYYFRNKEHNHHRTIEKQLSYQKLKHRLRKEQQQNERRGLLRSPLEGMYNRIEVSRDFKKQIENAKKRKCSKVQPRKLVTNNTENRKELYTKVQKALLAKQNSQKMLRNRWQFSQGQVLLTQTPQTALTPSNKQGFEKQIKQERSSNPEVLLEPTTHNEGFHYISCGDSPIENNSQQFYNSKPALIARFDDVNKILSVPTTKSQTILQRFSSRLVVQKQVFPHKGQEVSSKHDIPEVCLSEWRIIQPFSKLFLCTRCYEYFLALEITHHEPVCQKKQMTLDEYRNKLLRLSHLLKRLSERAEQQKYDNHSQYSIQTDKRYNMLHQQISEIVLLKKGNLERVRELRDRMKGGSLEVNRLFWLVQLLIQKSYEYKDEQAMQFWKVCI